MALIQNTAGAVFLIAHASVVGDNTNKGIRTGTTGKGRKI
jgi:hypothetical protein